MARATVAPSGGTTTLLLERDAQIAALQALADAARSGDGRFVVIEGSAGIGKTRLLGEARAIAGSRGMRALAARGGEFEGGFAYGIVRQLFEPLLATAPPNLRAELLSGPAALVERLFGTSRLVASPERDGEGSFAVLHGLYWLAANVAFQQPTLLALDDLHWCDTPSLRWLFYLTRRLEGLPLLVVAATRPPEAESREPTLVADLIADSDATAIRPEPLGRSSIAVLAREPRHLEPDEAFSAALETATGGNPLFVGAVLDAVSREGISPTAEQAPRLLEIGAQGSLARSGFASPGCRQRHLHSSARPRSSATGPSCVMRQGFRASRRASSARPPRHSFAWISSVVRIHSSLSTRSSAARSTRRWTSWSAVLRTASPRSCC